MKWLKLLEPEETYRLTTKKKKMKSMKMSSEERKMMK
jgi:hypothetical protein